MNIVQKWGEAVKRAVISREDILSVSRELIRSRGWEAVNIRAVAAADGVAVGSIYNYFGSKAELAEATVESVWREIFHSPGDNSAFSDVQSCIMWIYDRMEQGSRDSPGLFTLHSMSFVSGGENKGRAVMQRTWQHMRHGLIRVIQRDRRVRTDAFTGDFTEEKFAQILFSLMLSAMLQGDFEAEPVLELTRRVLY